VSWIIAFVSEHPLLFADAFKDDELKSWFTELHEHTKALGWLDFYRTDDCNLRAL